MFSKIKTRKTKLALAFAGALTAATMGGTAQAVNLTPNGLGDAALFQYYSANADWKTFIRLVNTSATDAIAVKVRFREAANSREVLDFVVMLSPNDVWTGWATATASDQGTPGLRTNDTSCIMPIPDSNGTPGQGFKSIGSGNTVAAAFQSTAFTGKYDDGAGVDVTDRLSEGEIEVIGIAQWDMNQFDTRDIVSMVTHNSRTGKPNDCGGAYDLFQATGTDAFGNIASGGVDLDNVLAANAYLINVKAGQGVGYNPTILANFTNRQLVTDTIASDMLPDLDSARPVSTMLNGSGGLMRNWFGTGGIAGTAHNNTSASPSPLGYNVDLDNDGSYITNNIQLDTDGDGICETIDEANVSPALYNQILGSSPQYINTASTTVCPSGALIAAVVTANQDIIVPSSNGGNGTVGSSPRVAQYGVGSRFVTGGVDAVSSLLMRTSVINEWAASYNPGAAITDYFTQWVLNFPTKHYYVDLQDDDKNGDEIAPTLVDPDETANNAYAPFTSEFDISGKSCESFATNIYNREEREVDYTSPAPTAEAKMCWETNVLTFNDRYKDRGLESNFAMVIPEGLLPTDYNGDVSERGWARLAFAGSRATNVGLIGYSDRAGTQLNDTFLGLPVQGMMLSIYNTGASATNHATVSSHKYETSND